ncbi:5-oxoprolinase subunit B family protein [Streptomyces sp. cmx-18-6]|uniref:5-oxoprolinase subunit B family protein n=1 Tax=Streptomyces sp. cmx-18-6 TaxID=2790930 RepID=UPI00397EC3DE
MTWGVGSDAYGIRVLPAGPHALLVELADGERAEAFHAEVLRRRERGALPGVREIVPGARTVLLDGIGHHEQAGGSASTARDRLDRDRLARDRLARDRLARDRLARDLLSWPVPPLRHEERDAVEIPVVYDGPDLAEVAALWGVGVDEVGGLHSRTAFRVAFCGFAPGFGYLTGLPERLHVPRRTTPRTRVPAGAVALAGPYTGVYPRVSPGGWQLIGRMVEPAALWDPDREPAALLAPGTRVRFVASAPVAASPVAASPLASGLAASTPTASTSTASPPRASTSTASTSTASTPTASTPTASAPVPPPRTEAHG